MALFNANFKLSAASPRANPLSPGRSSEAGPSSYAQLEPNHESSYQTGYNDVRDFAYEFPQPGRDQFGSHQSQPEYQNTFSHSSKDQHVDDNRDPNSQRVATPLQTAHHSPSAAVLRRFESEESPWSVAAPTDNPHSHRRRVSEAHGTPQSYRHEETDPDKLQEDLHEMEHGTNNSQRGKKRRRTKSNSKSNSQSPPDQEPKRKHHRRDEHERGGQRGQRHGTTT